MPFTIKERLVAAYKAFREPMLTAGLMDETEYDEYDSRIMRYRILWAYYQNAAYRNINQWAKAYKAAYGLYRYTRNIYNPSHRLTEFHVSHLWGGLLDPDAGPGRDIPSALPIMTDNDALRPAIAQLWQWSNWQMQKSKTVRWGAALGDPAIKIMDDPDKQRVRLVPIHPGRIKEKTMDAYGNVKGYVLEYERDDPRGSDRRVVYTEIAERGVGDNIHYTTLLDGDPYPWDGFDVSEWDVPYGFVPMVIWQHMDGGNEWGWSELHAMRAKVAEVDDLASKLHDQIRKTVDAPWLFTGSKKPEAVSSSGQTPTANRPAPGRDEVKALYGGLDGDVKAIVADLDLPAVSAEIQSMLQEIERDYPELQLDLHREMADTTGKALRTARAGSEDKMIERRPAYDDSLVRAQQMAIAIAGWRKYGDEFTGFDLNSYGAGALDHSIGDRPVFRPDPQDEIDLELAEWQAAKAAVDAGVPLPVYLKSRGWDDEDIADLLAAQERELQNQVRLQAAQGLGNTAATLAGLGRTIREGRQQGQGQGDQQPPQQGEGGSPAADQQTQQ